MLRNSLLRTRKSTAVSVIAGVVLGGVATVGSVVPANATTGCAGANTFAAISSASAWTTAAFADGTPFADHETSSGSQAITGAKEKTTGVNPGSVNPSSVDMSGNGESLTVTRASVPTLQYYMPDRVAALADPTNCYAFFRLRLVSSAANNSRSGLDNYAWKVALGNADSGTVGWVGLDSNSRYITSSAGTVLYQPALPAGLGSASADFWADTTTVASGGVGYWLNWRFSIANLQQYAPGAINLPFAVLAGTATSANGTTWNKDCMDGFPAQDHNVPPHTLDSCNPNIDIWRYLLTQYYTVTYTTTGSTSGSAPTDTATYAAADTVTVKSSTLVKSGYHQTGWSPSPVVTCSSVGCPAASTFSMPGANVTLSPVWAPNAPAVQYTSGPTGTHGTTTSSAVEETVTAGNSVTPVTIGLQPNSGPVDSYTISCAPSALPANVSMDTTTGTISGLIAPGETPTDYSCSVTAHGPGGDALALTYLLHVVAPPADSVNITFDANGGAFADSTTTHVQTVNNNADALLSAPAPNPTRTGYTFLGWNTSSGASDTLTTYVVTFSDAATHGPLYAIWRAQAYPMTVIQPGSGGSGSVATDTATYGGVDTFTATPATGYHFTNWTCDPAPTSDSSNPLVISPVTGAVACTPHFAPNSYTVNYNANGGSNAPASDSATYTVAYTPQGQGGMSKSGYTFVGWNTQADGLGSGYTPGTPYPYTHDITLYAQWTLTPLAMTAQAGPGGSASVSNSTIAPGGSATFTATPNAGYTFTGWTCSPSPASSTSNPLVLTNVQSATTCTANFQPIPVVPDPPQVSIIGQCSVSGTTLTIAGSFATRIASVTVNGVQIASSQWTQTGTSVTITMPAGSTGSAVVQLFNGQVPLLTAVTCNYPAAPPVTPPTPPTPPVTPPAPQVPLQTTPKGNGKINVGPNAGPFAPGSLVTLTAAPDPGWIFIGWTGDCGPSSANPFTLTMDKAKNCTANFETIKPVPAGTYAPTSANSSNIVWQDAQYAKSYIITVDGRQACVSTPTGCDVKQLLGPNSKVYAIAVNGNLKATPTRLTYSPNGPVRVFVVHFPESQYVLKASEKKILDKVGALMVKLGFKNLKVAAYTDAQGGTSGASTLSKNRANIVVQYLSKYLKVTAVAAGYGNTNFVAGNSTEAGRAANRRAEGWVQ